MIWVAKNLYFFNCLLDGAHTNIYGVGFSYRADEFCFIRLITLSRVNSSRSFSSRAF